MEVLREQAHNVQIAGQHWSKHCEASLKPRWHADDDGALLERQSSQLSEASEASWCNENLEELQHEDYSSLCACPAAPPVNYDDEALVRADALTAVGAAQQHADAPNSNLSLESGTRACNLADLLAQIRNEQQREADLRPAWDYLEQHDTPADPEAFITPQMRMIVTSWMCEVAAEYKLQQETLFVAVALLDRFLSTSPGVPRSVLQLVAVSCIFLASKQEEVAHPTVEELVDISANCFLKEDLLRMEMILLDNLNWRIKAPTAYSFLHLLCQGLEPRLPPLVTATAAYLTELSLLDYSMLRCPPSLIAGAAVLLAQASHSSAAPSWAAMQQLTGHSPSALHAGMRMLLQLQHYSWVAHSHEAYQPLLFVREKYSVEGWLLASVRAAPLAALPPTPAAV